MIKKPDDVIDYLQKGINKAGDTKEAIREAYSSYEYIREKVQYREIVGQASEKTQVIVTSENKSRNEFNIGDIERIVLKPTKPSEREER